MHTKMNVLLLAALLVVTSLYAAKDGKIETQASEPAYERIMASRTIRCSYTVWPPFLIKDPTTNKMSGVYYDLLEKIGKDLKLEIKWVEDTGTYSFLEGLKTGRTDLYCSPVTPAPERARVADFTMPVAYLPYYLYAKTGDSRFDRHYEKLNAPQYTMMSIDGYFGAIVIKEDFPKATYTTVSDFSTDSDVLMSIATGKADAAPCLAFSGQDYMKNNPGKIRQVEGAAVRNASIALALPLGEEKLKTLLNTTLAYNVETGFMDRLFDAYNLDATKLRRLAKTYQ